MYILLEDNKVKEIIPDIDPISPVSLSRRDTPQNLSPPCSMWRMKLLWSRIGFMTLKRRPSPHPLSRSRNQNLK